MNKSAIKNFAVWARRELIERVSQKAVEYGIEENNIVSADADIVNGKVLSAAEKQQRKALIAEINDKGYEQVIEQTAYTWFNRFIALRFMEVNGYLPSHIRVFTDEDNNFKPQILTEAIHLELDGLDMDKVYEFKDSTDDERLFKYLFKVQCNALSSILPRMFERLEDYSELLLPDNLLREGSVIEQMITLIPQEDWTDQVQIIGWLYQYYNTEPKDKVFADLKKNIKITKENIPAATQLFTPDWIVRYMVENSLGRLWIEYLLSHSGHGMGNWESSNLLKNNWDYYIEEADQEPEVAEKLLKLRSSMDLELEEIKVLDPCMGSGHILVYAFDVLMQIYEDRGYTAREAVPKIIENNLFGLDIDERAAQLAYFSVMMKARQYDRRFFNKKDAYGNSAAPQPNVYTVQESGYIDKNGNHVCRFSEFMLDYFINGDLRLSHDINTLINELFDAKEYGSILHVSEVDFDALYARFDEIADDISSFKQEALSELLPFVKVAQVMAKKYDVVVTNPPYMGAGNMNPKLNDYIKKNYSDYKSDLFAAFIVRCTELTKRDGYLGFLSPYVWMFIQSYEKLRNYMYSAKTIETLIQFEYSAFEEATVPICTFAIKNSHVSKKGCYLRLTDFRGGMEVQRQKALEAISNHNCGFYYESNSDNFSKIPGSPVAYWVSENFIRAFDNKKMGSRFEAIVKGIFTGDNKRFLRLWFEVDANKINTKWMKYSKGGDFRRWYGNMEYVINWGNSGKELKSFHGSGLGASKYFGNVTIVWTKLSSYKTGFRKNNKDIYFDDASPALVCATDDVNYELALLNSSVCFKVLEMISPTLNFQCGEIKKIPIIVCDSERKNVKKKADENISISKCDWDAFETSWDFEMHPIVKKAISRSHWGDDGDTTIEYVYKFVAQDFENRFNQLKANEEELNRIFIDIYGLQDELTPEVEDKDVTVRRADLQRDIKSLISYAVGCMFGRYSPFSGGLAYAGGEWHQDRYRGFMPDEDNIIPICDDEYFDDDIVGRFAEFVKAVFGESTLEANLRFIADALGGSGSPRDVIRKYFINDFYKDHCKIYQKRPIYWLFDSGKKNGFKCLIYMHRYEPDTIARIRTDYIHEQQSRYRTAITDVEQRINGASTSDRVKLNKQLKTLKDQADEIRIYEEKIHHLADQMIPIDLDDGVKVNYAKFADVLAKIK